MSSIIDIMNMSVSDKLPVQQHFIAKKTCHKDTVGWEDNYFSVYLFVAWYIENQRLQVETYPNDILQIELTLNQRILDEIDQILILHGEQPLNYFVDTFTQEQEELLLKRYKEIILLGITQSITYSTIDLSQNKHRKLSIRDIAQYLHNEVVHKYIL